MPSSSKTNRGEIFVYTCWQLKRVKWRCRAGIKLTKPEPDPDTPDPRPIEFSGKTPMDFSGFLDQAVFTHRNSPMELMGSLMLLAPLKSMRALWLTSIGSGSAPK